MTRPLTEPRTEHLSEMELDEVLLADRPGDVAADAREHLAACEFCQAELAALTGTIEGFNAVTLAWSERQASTMPLRPPVEQVEAAVQPLWQRLLAPRNLAWAGTAATALMVGLISMPRHSAATTQTPQAQMRALPSATEFAPGREDRIAHDNRMLNEINRVLEASDESTATPAAEMQLEPVRTPHNAAAHDGAIAD